jgi:hypothetical protein
MASNRGFFSNPNDDNLNNPDYQVKNKKNTFKSTATSGINSGSSTAYNVSSGTTTTTTTTKTSTTTTTTTFKTTSGPSVLNLDASGNTFKYFIYDENNIKSNVIDTGILTGYNIDSFQITSSFITTLYYDSNYNFYIKNFDFNGNVLQTQSLGFIGYVNYGGSTENLVFYEFRNQGIYSYLLITQNTYLYLPQNDFFEFGDINAIIFDVTGITYTYYILNNDGTLSNIIDTGVSTSNFSTPNIDEFNGSYFIQFYDGNNYVNKFINKSGNMVNSITTTDPGILDGLGDSSNDINININLLYFYWYYVDGSDTIFYYSDGDSFYNYTFTNSTIDQLGSYFDNCMDKGFVVRTLSEGVYYWYSLDGLGNVNLIVTEDPNYQYQVGTSHYTKYWNANFIVNIVFSNLTGYYDRIDFIDKSGSILHTVSLTSYQNYNAFFASHNKFAANFYDSSSNFLFVYYNSNTDSLLTKTLSDVNYQNLIYDWSDNTVVFYLYGNGSIYSNDYLEFIDIKDDDTNINDPVVINNGSQSLVLQDFFKVTSDFIMVPVISGSYSNLMQFTYTRDNGSNLNDTGIPLYEFNYVFYSYEFNNQTISVYQIPGSNVLMINSGVTASISQVIYLNSFNTDSAGWDYPTNPDLLFLVRDYTNQITYYLNSTTNKQLVATTKFFNNYNSYNSEFLLVDLQYIKLIDATTIGSDIDVTNLISGYQFPTYPVVNSGYVLELYNDFNSHILFIGPDATLINKFTITSDYSINQLLDSSSEWCKYICFSYQNGNDTILYYFDGVSIYSHTFVNLSIGNLGSIFGDTLDKGFVAHVYDLSNNYSWYYLNGSGDTYKLFDEQSDFNYYVFTLGTNYITTVKYNNTYGWFIIEIYNKSGVLISTSSQIQLDDFYYNISDTYSNFLFYNHSNQDYQIINYNPNTNTLLTKSISNNNFNNFGAFAFYVGVVYIIGSSDQSYLNYYTIYNGDTSISDPFVVNNGTATTTFVNGSYYYCYLTNNYSLSYVNLGDGYLWQMIINKGNTVNFYNTNVLLNIYSIDFNNLLVDSTTTSINYYGGIIWIVNGPSGSITSKFTTNYPSYIYSSGYLSNNYDEVIIDRGIQKTYYLNNNTNYQFVDTNSYYDNVYYNNNYSYWFYDNKLLLINQNSNIIRYLDPNTLGSDITLNVNLSDVYFSKDYYSYVTVDNNNNYFILSYNYNGQMLQYIPVGQFDYYNGVNNIGNLVVYSFTKGNNGTTVILSKTKNLKYSGYLMNVFNG